jgi:hypothetical protein
MTDQREKRIQEIQGFLEVSWRYAEDGVTMEGYQEDVGFLLAEVSRLQVERDKAIEALRKLSEVVPNALALEEVRDLL